MPRQVRELTALEVRRLGVGLHAVGGVSGLCLQVTERGAKSWILRITILGKRREMGLGPFPEVSLAVARGKAAEIKEEVRQGRDPIAERRAARKSLAEERSREKCLLSVVDEFVPIKAAELAPGKYRDQWRDSIGKYVLPELGSMRIKDITRNDIRDVLQPIWVEKHVTADKLRRKLNEVFDYAIFKEYCSPPNPAAWAGNLALALPAVVNHAKRKNFPSVQTRDAARFWRMLSQRDGVSANALRFQVLTALRPGAVRFMTWKELDFQNLYLTVQPGRQSAKIFDDIPKRVPLTPQMLSILRAQKDLSLASSEDENSLVFRAPRGGAISDATLGSVMKKIHASGLREDGVRFNDVQSGFPAVPHGWRSTFKMWATEVRGFEWNLSEAALWHSLGSKVERAYARTDLLERRREMMVEWGQFLAPSEIG